MGLVITTSTTFIFGLVSFTFCSLDLYFVEAFVLDVSSFLWHSQLGLHPSMVFSGCLNSFRGFDQF